MSTSPDLQTCTLCGGSLAPCVARPHTSYAERARYRIDRCDRCGAGATMPRPTSDELRACYARDIVNQVCWLARYEQRPPKFDRDSLTNAVRAYFVSPN